MRNRPIGIVFAIGLGLILAPVVFGMFTRAPKGGEMISSFRPFMTEAKLDTFDAHLATIDDAHAETQPLAARDTGFADRYERLAAFNRDWPDINEDMSGMLGTIRGNLDNYTAVDALPPFPLFPWFFVLPGVLLALVARSAIKSSRYTYPRKRLIFLAVMGLGLIAAPAIFQMFTRAPLGAEMIEEFTPLMTSERVTAIQGYFLVIASGEGDIRTELRPAIEDAGGSLERELPAAAAFVDGWQRISFDMAPMIGAMSDNLDNFAAVKALPPFSLFPWFFVIPGVLVAGLALAAMRPAPAEAKAAVVATPTGGGNG